MLGEAQHAARRQHPPNLGHDGVRVLNRTQHECGDHRVEGRVIERQRLPWRGVYRRGPVKACGASQVAGPKIGIRFDRRQRHRGREVRQIPPGPGADLKHPPGCPTAHRRTSWGEAQINPAQDGVEQHAVDCGANAHGVVVVVPVPVVPVPVVVPVGVVDVDVDVVGSSGFGGPFSMISFSGL